MFLRKNVLFVLAISVFVFCETALVDTFKKCSVSDTECIKGVFQSLVHTIADQGIPEVGISKLDPLELKDVSISVLGILNVTLLEGTVEGVKTCDIKNLIFDMKEGKLTCRVVCDKIIILGNYELELDGSLLKAAGIGGDVHGKGKGKIVIDKVEVHVGSPFQLRKKDDGVHINFEVGATEFTFNVLENASFEADNLVIGDKEASKEIIKYMNDNWKVIMQTFGKFFFDKVIEYVTIFANKFFNKISIQHFINEDLSSYVIQ